MKRFDMKAAIEGKPVVTRSGHAVTQLKVFKLDNGTDVLWGVVDGKIVDGWDAFGVNCDDRESSLFMVEEDMFVILGDGEISASEIRRAVSIMREKPSGSLGDGLKLYRLEEIA